jgi:hypothetical protein
MSRITGSEVASLMEAYSTVYTPQELTEEQIQEDFENWVNSLVEEGHDLSEYTWEDMYEEYLNEIAVNLSGSRTKGAVTTYGANDPRRTSSGPYQSRFARPMNDPARTVQRPVRYSDGKPQIGGMGGLGTGYRGAELQQAARARASQVGTPRQGTAGGPTTGGNTPINVRPTTSVPTRPTTQAPARPSASAARPTAQAPARPASTAPIKPDTAKSSTSTTPAAPARTFNPLMQRTFGYQTGNAPSQIAAASAGKPIPSGSALGSAANPEVRKKLNLPTLKQSFDVFDVIKGHLIDEGYADTEEAALQIMANMSEEWRESIVEAKIDAGKGDKEKQMARWERGTGGDILPRRRKKTRGEKIEKIYHQDREGNPTGKYSQMQHQKRQAQRERDADEQNRRDKFYT